VDLGREREGERVERPSMHAKQITPPKPSLLVTAKATRQR
jgi:hypothetical protein